MGLTPKQAAFVEAYRGDATRAARAAGYSGSPNTLAVRGHKLLRHPGVRAAIAARGGTLPALPGEAPAEPSEAPTAGPEASPEPRGPVSAAGDEDASPEAVLRQLMADGAVHPSARARVAEIMLRRQDRAEAAPSPEQILETLQQRMAEGFAARRSMERDTGRCGSCGQRLPGRERR